MSKWLYIQTIVILFSSCSAVGEYYTDPKDTDIENIEINTDAKKNVGFSVYVYKEEFTVTVYYKLLDTINCKDCQIKQINFQINNVSSEIAEKGLSCIDIAEEIKFNELRDIPFFDKKIYSGLPLKFIYKFNKDQINDRDRIKVSVKLLVNENGKDTTIEKNFEMIRHTRYKSWFVS